MMPDDQLAWRRFHIMGGAGSGKTTLARQLGSQLHVPCYHLDHIAYERGAGRKIALDERLESLRTIIAQPGWVTEGSFLWWTDMLLETADVIVWLDLPFRINGWRIVKRHVLLSIAGTNPHPGTLNLVRFTWGAYSGYKTKTPLIPKAPDDDFAVTRIATAQILSGYTNKLVQCHSPRDVKGFLDNVTSGKKISST